MRDFGMTRAAGHLFVISTGGRAAAGAEKSGCEEGVSVFCIRGSMHLVQAWLARRVNAQTGDTQCSRPDFSTLPGRTVALRAEAAPKKLTGRMLGAMATLA
jgi:hypothetical protein